MACLGSVLYDPATAATAATTAATALTAFDTTNARITFTAPTNGNVIVKVRAAGKGASAVPMVLLGVLESTTVRGRQVPISQTRSIGTASLITRETQFPVTGLTGGGSYTFDAAYGVEALTAATQLGWGGADNTAASDAYGALVFEVWEATNLLGAKQYDPATAASVSVAAATVMTALDTTNLRLTFTAPASGRVAVRLRTVASGAANNTPTVFLGVLDGVTVRMRVAGWGQVLTAATQATTDWHPLEAMAVIGGLTGGNSYTFDAAYGVETAIAGSSLWWGGPDNTTVSDAYGGFTFEIWGA